MFPRTLTRPAVLCLTLLATPAAAEGGLEPGFWIFPQTPGLSQGVLSDMCQHGMTLVQADGVHVSFLADLEAVPPRMVIDQEAACAAADGGLICTTRTYTGAGPVDSRARLALSQDAQGHRVSVHTDLATGTVHRSHPQRCPDAGVRDFMIGWLALRPGS